MLNKPVYLYRNGRLSRIRLQLLLTKRVLKQSFPRPCSQYFIVHSCFIDRHYKRINCGHGRYKIIYDTRQDNTVLEEETIWALGEMFPDYYKDD